jgi:aryl-alcohol dehydrogenase-like predicted oxidoreductase
LGLVSSAIVGASRPEQVVDNAGAAGKTVPEDALKRIDEVLAGIVIDDPSLTARQAPKRRPA